MKTHNILYLILFTLGLCLCACSSHGPAVLKSNQSPSVVNIIALLPVESNAADSKASKMLRTKLFEELRFKGYPNIDFDLIDSKLMTLVGEKEIKKNDVIPPKVIEELLGADGAMYCSLQEIEISTRLFYAPVTVSVRCELRNTHTGETLWNAQYRSTSRSFDLFSKRLKMKSRGGVEDALEEAVGKVMETLPDGPKLRG